MEEESVGDDGERSIGEFAGEFWQTRERGLLTKARKRFIAIQGCGCLAKMRKFLIS